MLNPKKKAVVFSAGLLVLILMFGFCLDMARKQLATKTPSAEDSKRALLDATPDASLFDIRFTLPAGWKLQENSDSSIMLDLGDTGSVATLSAGKCDDTGDYSCFGSGRNNPAKTPSGEIFSLVSTDTVANFGLNLGGDKGLVLYYVSADFGQHQYSPAELDMICDFLMSVSLK